MTSFSALAATVTVTTIADDLTPNDASVSLCEAITAINAGNDLADPDITAQSPGTFGVTTASTSTSRAPACTIAHRRRQRGAAPLTLWRKR